MKDDGAANASTNTLVDHVTRWLLVVIAVAAALAGAWRAVATDTTVVVRLDATTLTYFAVAAALLLLREVKSLAFGDLKLEFERTKKVAEEAKRAADDANTNAQEARTTAKDAQATAVGNGEGKTSTATGSAATLRSATGPGPQPGNVPDDPWKRAFNGSPRQRNRILEAEVRSVAGSSTLFDIRLSVRSEFPETDPLRGTVQFFLHPTFARDKPVVTVNQHGVAELNLRAYGAFTVGALADDGRTTLELDLAELPGIPAVFAAT